MAGWRRVRRLGGRVGGAGGRMLQVEAQRPAEQHDAYFQLVEHPIAALSNLYQLYFAVAWNRAAAANDARANVFADRRRPFARDGELTALPPAERRQVGPMMAQTHIGYTGWQQPEARCDAGGEARRGQGRALKPVVFGPSAPTEITSQRHLHRGAALHAHRRCARASRWKAITHLGPHAWRQSWRCRRDEPPTTQADGVRRRVRRGGAARRATSPCRSIWRRRSTPRAATRCASACPWTTARCTR